MHNWSSKQNIGVIFTDKLGNTVQVCVEAKSNSCNTCFYSDAELCWAVSKWDEGGYAPCEIEGDCLPIVFHKFPPTDVDIKPPEG